MRVPAIMLLLLLLLGLAGGCGSEDPFTADMKMICSAGGGHTDLPPEMRRVAALRDVAKRIRTAEAVRLMEQLAQVPSEERAALLREPLAKAGIKRCAFFEP